MTTNHPVTGAELFDKAIAISVSVEGISGARKVSLDNVTVDADKDRLRMSAKILQCPEMGAISNLFTQLRAAISDPKRGVALPTFFKRGVYMLPKTSIGSTEAMLTEYQATLKALVTALVAVYPQRIAEDRVKLRDKFSEKHYPSSDALPTMFNIRWRYLSLRPSAELGEISSDIYQAEVERVRKEVQTLGDDIKASLRQAAFEIVAHMKDRLTPDASGQPKIFRDSMVNNLVDFLDAFDAKNIMGDSELSEALGQMKALLSGVTPKDIRTNEAMRNAFTTKVNEILPVLSGLVEASGRHVEVPDDGEE